MSSKQQSTGSTDTNQPTPTAHKSRMTRRDLLRRSAVGAATVGAVSTGAVRLDHGPVQNSQAIAPAVVAGGIGASAAAGWALRELEIVGSDSLPEGMTEGAFKQSAYDTLRARKSTNQSTILDNQNILDGISHTAYADGKIAAIDALNEQESEGDVLSAATDAVDDYETTIQKNLLKTWNESVQELDNIVEATDEHPDISKTGEDSPYSAVDGCYWLGSGEYDFAEGIEHDLPNGETIDVYLISFDDNCGGTPYWSPIMANYGGTDAIFRADYGDDLEITYLSYDEWSGLLNNIKSEFDDVRDGLSEWVNGVYSDVQSGELDTAELLTPREQAELTAEEEDFPQAISDLQALNVSVDLEREAEIYIPDVSATLYGQLAYTGDRSLEVGTVDPDETDDDDDPVYPGTIYFNYDISQGQGDWDAYESGIDGGTLTITSEPFEETLYVVDTAAGETAEFTTDDLDDDGDVWTIDLSDQLDDQITEVDQIEFYSEVSETQYETIQLQDQFEIIDFTDSDGESYDETNFERSEPQTDDNYITEEEWQEQQERHEELIQQYEDAQGGGISIPGVEDVLDGEANGLIGIAVVGFVLVSAILSALNPLS